VSRVKIMFHDNCFDGATSAALFSRFFGEKIDSKASFEFVGKSHGQGDVFEPHNFDADVNVVVDFRYSSNPRLNWWFDHHVSAFPTPADEANFKTSARQHMYYDPAARSCSKFLAVTCQREFGWSWQPFNELVEWADLIDGAQFESPKAAVELADPALRLMTWVENNHDPALKIRFINDLTRRSLADIAAEPYVTSALTPILDRHKHAIDIVRGRAQNQHGVVFFDVTEDGTGPYNKFIPYYLYPDCHYVVGLSRISPSKIKISVGSNPWKSERRTANIAKICERYGGGGHPVVGAVSLGPNDLSRARQVAGEIVDELSRAARSEQ
jgi:hypothetical protein